MNAPQNCAVRSPDYTEEQDGAVLQIWGREGYWHIVDAETQDLIKAASKIATFEDLLKSHPDWAQQERAIVEILESVRRGLANHPQPAPVQIENVSLNVVTMCNLHCATCYVPAQDRKPQKLDVTKAINFLEKLGNRLSATATISLLGGEPFLHPEGVLTLATWAQKRGHGCNVSTNGTISLRTLSAQIRAVGLRVQISIDGANSGTNDALRGAGTFERALCTARDLIAVGVHTTLSMVACQENQDEIGDYLRFAKTLGASEARVMPLKRLGNAKNGKPTPATHRSILEKVTAAIDRDPSLEKLCQSDLYAILRTLVSEQSRRQSCGSGTQTLLLQADGTLYPCINNTMSQAKLGTTDDCQAVIRNGEKWGNQLSVDNLNHPCHPCAVKRWCLAGCPGETIQCNGNLRNAHSNCADLKDAITYMMWQSDKRTLSHPAERTRI